MAPKVREVPRFAWSLRALGTLTLAIGICVLGTSLIFLYQTVRTPVSSNDSFLVVKPGSGVTHLARQLVSEGLAGSEWPVIAWAVLSGTAGSFKAGEYFIPAKTTPAQILGKLSRGGVHQRKLTIIEGLRFSQLRERLVGETHLAATVASLSERDILDELAPDRPSVEGLFFPDTYYFLLEDTDMSILTKAAGKMDRELMHAWQNRAADLVLDDPYEALTMASIIQKEAMLESEMPRISGVLHNRLKRKMRLQTDPTVIFGLGPGFKGPLKRSDLKKDTPYNTYTRAGLPPGPIALPGRSALLAAVNPLATEDLYFVAKGDGSHHFSKTLKEHNRAVKKYRN
ncbi:MAG TPA: endolytic transglycosylase MltG [Gammaproteobacteria bacterium]|nr:aminodeoxychorismate lyase [Acidiferrobacteraceae bacterium]MDP6552285.1 endolytic transglycosylase MltG [Arenicellales bacterium]MDP6790428.1 endolytic transglycosylase MltG [Arenicellales bacterium]MDP6919551.1 endolytic transglycosylase MltG [Arenicellales bacterium]HCX86918.1 endolytic transglycosylase MltG [Gammaproteobacteria bacterium]